MERIQEVVETVLLNKGVELKPGTVEIYPSRTRPIRLPLGAGSFLLDTELKVLGFSTEESMEIFEVYGTEETHQIKLEVLQKEIGLDKVRSTSKSIYIKRGDTIEYSSLHSEPETVHELWTCGLTEKGTRNAATRILISQCYKIGLSQDDAYTKIHDWLCTKNNGNSEDWTNRSEWVLSNLWTMIQARYALGGRRGAALTIEDVKQLLLLVNDNYKQLQFCYSLLLHFKSIGKDTLNISKNTLCSFDGSCNTTYQQRIRFCLEHGLVVLSKDYCCSPELKRAREFRCLFQHGESNNLVRSLEQAVMEVLGATEVKRRFGRYRFNEVQNVLGGTRDVIVEAKSG